jgi:hypothetical protein
MQIPAPEFPARPGAKVLGVKTQRPPLSFDQLALVRPAWVIAANYSRVFS